ncbi:hypothetical protein CBL_01116 [Carabus blaptoides fortunei]
MHNEPLQSLTPADGGRICGTRETQWENDFSTESTNRLIDFKLVELACLLAKTDNRPNIHARDTSDRDGQHSETVANPPLRSLVRAYRLIRGPFTMIQPPTQYSVIWLLDVYVPLKRKAKSLAQYSSDEGSEESFLLRSHELSTVLSLYSWAFSTVPASRKIFREPLSNKNLE